MGKCVATLKEIMKHLCACACACVCVCVCEDNPKQTAWRIFFLINVMLLITKAMLITLNTG